jgi:hypothetical protein
LRDFYTVLGVDRGADAEAIRRAYLDQMKRFHPDRLGPDSAHEHRASEINHAFSVLRDPDRRAHYDHELKAQAEAYWRWEYEQQRQAALRRSRQVVLPGRRRRSRLGRSLRVLLALAVLAGVAYFYDEVSQKLVIPPVLAGSDGGELYRVRGGAAAVVPLSPNAIAGALGDYEWVSVNFGILGLSTHAMRCWSQVREEPSFTLLNRCAAFDVAADVYAGNLIGSDLAEAAYFTRAAREGRYRDALADIAEEADPVTSLALIEGATIRTMVDRLEQRAERGEVPPRELR